MKASDHKKVLKGLLEHGDDNEFCRAFVREVAISNHMLFNRVFDKLTVGVLAPFRCEWKEKVIAFLRLKNKLEAIKYIREYSDKFPSSFGGHPLSLVDAKNLVESLNPE